MFEGQWEELTKKTVKGKLILSKWSMALILNIRIMLSVLYEHILLIFLFLNSEYTCKGVINLDHFDFL